MAFIQKLAKDGDVVAGSCVRERSLWTLVAGDRREKRGTQPE